MRHLNPAPLILALLAAVLLSTGAAAQLEIDAFDVFEDPRVLDGKGLQEQFETAETSVEVIVTLAKSPEIQDFPNWKDRSAAVAHRERVGAHVEALLGRVLCGDVELHRRLENLPVFSCVINLAGLRKLLSEPIVESVEFNKSYQLQTFGQVELMLRTEATKQLRVDTGGRGVSIAVVDSGIDGEHFELGGEYCPNSKVIGGADLYNNDYCPMGGGDLEHGTAVAGAAAGNRTFTDEVTWLGGIALHAKLYDCRVISWDGLIYQIYWQMAWDWCLTHQYDDPDNPILVLCNSFSSMHISYSVCDGGSVDTLIDALHSAGITIFAAAGNHGLCNGMTDPACRSGVISVGGTTALFSWAPIQCVDPLSCVAESGGNCNCNCDYTCDMPDGPAEVVCYSNSAPFLDLLAPSDNTTTLEAGGTFKDATGTSIACGLASGAAAVIISYARDRGIELTPDEVRNLLTSTGDLITDPKSSVQTPLINLDAALAAIPRESVWVDFAWTGMQYGTRHFPYSSFAAGANDLLPAGTMHIKAGATTGVPGADHAMQVRAEGGPVTIRQ